MKRLKRVVRFLDAVTDRVLLFGFLFLFFIGAYALYDSYLVYSAANDTSWLAYKPGYEGTETETKPIQGQMVAWLTVPDTNIDYPVMQGENNQEYLTKDPFGEYSLAGSIFLDSRNTPNFCDQYSLIYGHHMEAGMMFGALDAFSDAFYRDAHPTATLMIEDRNYSLELFAFLEGSATEEALFSPTERPVVDTLAVVREHAFWFSEDSAPGISDRIVALSTCKYPDTVERTLLFYKILDP